MIDTATVVSSAKQHAAQLRQRCAEFAQPIAGRAVLVTNVDAYLEDDLVALVEGWDGERPRLLVRTGDTPADFGPHHYVGACLVPGAASSPAVDT